MSNGADRTLEDDEGRQQLDEVGQKLDDLIKLIERSGRKVTSLHIQFGDSPERRYGPAITTEEKVKIPQTCTGAGLRTPAGRERYFELRPVADQAVAADDFQALGRDEDPLH